LNLTFTPHTKVALERFNWNLKATYNFACTMLWLVFFLLLNNCIPLFLMSDKDSVEQKMKRLEAQYAAFQIVSLVGRYGSEQVRNSIFLLLLLLLLFLLNGLYIRS